MLTSSMPLMNDIPDLAFQELPEHLHITVFHEPVLSHFCVGPSGKGMTRVGDKGGERLSSIGDELAKIMVNDLSGLTPYVRGSGGKGTMSPHERMGHVIEEYKKRSNIHFGD